MSLGGLYSELEEKAVDYAVNTKGRLLVAAAGNDNTNQKSYPAGFSESFPNKVIAVAAHDDNRCKASFSNYGTWVSITAPGVDILSTTPIEGVTGSIEFDVFNGTSMASPFVAGAAAVAWALNPGYTNSQIGQLITTKTANEPLNRDGTCWLNDGSTFQALNLLHIVKPSEYEACNFAGVYGFSLNAENGEPLTGAKVTLLSGTAIKGTDYVPYFGYLSDPYFNFFVEEAYGLFHIFTDATNSSLKLLISKKKFAKPRLDVTTAICNLNYAGNIPVPPNRPYYWLAITWDYANYAGLYDAYLKLPGTYGYIGYGGIIGNLNDFPWARWLWDSDEESTDTLRAFSEVIRIKKMMSGTYSFFVDDWDIGSGSTSWQASGIKAYIYRWDPATLTQKLIKVIKPVTGCAGEIWHIADLQGNKVTEVNSCSDVAP